MVRVELELIIL